MLLLAVLIAYFILRKYIPDVYAYLIYILLVFTVIMCAFILVKQYDAADSVAAPIFIMTTMLFEELILRFCRDTY